VTVAVLVLVAFGVAFGIGRATRSSKSSGGRVVPIHVRATAPSVPKVVSVAAVPSLKRKARTKSGTGSPTGSTTGAPTGSTTGSVNPGSTSGSTTGTPGGTGTGGGSTGNTTGNPTGGGTTTE
jgi:hypothetical protein